MFYIFLPQFCDLRSKVFNMVNVLFDNVENNQILLSYNLVLTW